MFSFVYAKAHGAFYKQIYMYWEYAKICIDGGAWSKMFTDCFSRLSLKKMSVYSPKGNSWLLDPLSDKSQNEKLS